MMSQIVFLAVLLVTLGVFAYTTRKYIGYFKITKGKFPVRQIGRRFGVMMEVAIGQTKIFRRPVLGLLHALVFWGFLVILIGSVEMVIDGLFGTERVLSFLGGLYSFIVASGDIFALIIAIAILVFLFRRVFLHVKRFSGIEMKHISHLDANIALTVIFLLMVSLLGMNTFYLLSVTRAGHEIVGLFPVSNLFAGWIESGERNQFFHDLNWWMHILLIFMFANYLPYSKHFHVFMSVPNVFLSRLEPLGKLDTMESITKEVKIMMDPSLAFASPPPGGEGAAVVPGRFGVLDVEDLTWKSYMDSLACTECGRCSSVCPANITGKKLSPRKVVMDVRARMKEKGPGILKNGAGYSDNRSLIRDFVTEEELWACTLCNACAQECPININQPVMIVGMRRYLVMEESAAPGELNSIFSNIENNGAPWQFSQDDRMGWVEPGVEVPVMAALFAKGEKPEYLLWVGSAGAFDDRYKRVSRAIVKILNSLGTSYAVLGTEESSSGDVARRAGNEMLYQMQALMNIEVFKGYGVQKIITCDPHAYNTFKNEYTDLGGHYEVIHHSQFLRDRIGDGTLTLQKDSLKGNRIVFHDPCYLGRANKEYRAPRQVLDAFSSGRVEMGRHKSFALCCGAGGGQMFKEAEKGDKEVFIERTEQALATGADIIATACPYCMVMMTDGIKYKNQEEKVKNYDIAELVSMAIK
jgi:Fe-S oxidoreductase/nitrate reductase gamma subunit